MAKPASKFLLTFLLLLSSVCFGNTLVSPLNGKILDLEKNRDEYSFILIGHVYGSHNHSVYPSASLLAHIELLNQTNAQFMILLGDMVRTMEPHQIKNLKESFLDKLAFPVFNAPGNHDVTDLNLYEKTFGKTYFSFDYGENKFLFLDSEEKDGNIEGSQLEFAFNQINQYKKNRQNLFVFFHRVLWAIGNPPYDSLISHFNGTRWYPPQALSVTKKIIPELSSEKSAFLVAGDVGEYYSLPLFFEKSNSSNITYIATGIGDNANDSVLLVHYKKQTGFEFKALSLTGQTLKPVENYNLSYWNTYFKNKSDEPNQLKILIEKIERLLTHKYFWMGILVFAFFLILKKILLQKTK